jgi:hypothetical protein
MTHRMLAPMENASRTRIQARSAMSGLRATSSSLRVRGIIASTLAAFVPIGAERPGKNRALHLLETVPGEVAGH